MVNNTVKYYLDVLGADTGAYRVHINFETGLNNTSYYNNQYSLIAYNNLTGISGSGTFNSTTFARFSGITGLDGEFSTHVFVESKNNRTDGVLFSNFGGTGTYSGYTIGINDGNKLYFETRGQSGPVVKTFSPRLANKNIIAVSKINTDVNFYLLNQNTKELISDSHNIGNFCLPSNAWWLGTCTGNQSYQTHPNFSGYIDEYLYFSEALSPEDIGGVMSGFYQRYNDTSYSLLLTGYTNYTSGRVTSGTPSGINYNESGRFNYSGHLYYNTGGMFNFYDLGLLTGFSEIADDCGGSIFIYRYLNHTGVLEGDTFIPLTGNLVLTSQVSGFTSQSIPTGLHITGVTGYLSGLFPSFTGVTGSQTILSGFIADNCGNIQGTYITTDISGVLSGTGLSPLTGLIFSGLQETSFYNSDSLFDITFVFSPSYFTDDGYIYSLGMHGTNYLRNIDSGDAHEIYLPTTNHNLLLINKLGVFDNINSGFLLPDDTSLSGLNGFLNGVAQLGSGAAVSGDIYNPYYYLSGSFFISGTDLIRGNDYLNTDVFLYDIKTGARDFWIKDTGNVQSVKGIGNDIFLNGQKLRSGIEYTLTGNQINLPNYSGIEGTLFSFPRLEGVRSTGLTTTTVLFSTPFARNTSQIFLNGQRQLINNDYLEISNVDLLTGSGSFLSNQVEIYQNEGNFWS